MATPQVEVETGTAEQRDEHLRMAHRFAFERIGRASRNGKRREVSEAVDALIDACEAYLVHP